MGESVAESAAEAVVVRLGLEERYELVRDQDERSVVQRRRKGSMGSSRVS